MGGDLEKVGGLSGNRGCGLESSLLFPGLSVGLETSVGAMGKSKAQAGERGKRRGNKRREVRNGSSQGQGRALFGWESMSAQVGPAQR